VQVLQSGLSVQHMHISTLKPFTTDVMDAVAGRNTASSPWKPHHRRRLARSSPSNGQAGHDRKLVRIASGHLCHGASKNYLLKKYAWMHGLIAEVEALTGRSSHQPRTIEGDFIASVQHAKAKRCNKANLLREGAKDAK